MKQRRYICFNPVSDKGLAHFTDNFMLTKDKTEADCWLVRSAELSAEEFPVRLRTIARAGAGVNNIPVKRCTDQGIVVFNTPGANANAVVEMVIAGMLMASRDIVGGTQWVRTLDADAGIAAKVEKGKKAFAGTELRGKKLGVIGLGAIGHQVANVAVSMGMEVYGFDPFISVRYAWMLSRNVHHTESLDDLLAVCDYITIHVPLADNTKNMIGENEIAKMKDGVILLNFSRDILFDEEAVGAALEKGKVRKYVTDFANERCMGLPNTIITPHLGASTEESEENCSVMAVEEARDYLNNGTINNSVNFPNITLGDLKLATRVVVLHRNVPGILSKITTLFGEANINIDQMISSSKGDAACALFDIPNPVQREFVMQLSSQADILKVRVIQRTGE